MAWPQELPKTATAAAAAATTTTTTATGSAKQSTFFFPPTSDQSNACLVALRGYSGTMVQLYLEVHTTTTTAKHSTLCVSTD